MDFISNEEKVRYTETHEWVRVSGNIARVGISEYAQNQLGEVVYVELPEMGRSIHANDEIAVLESTKAAVDIYCPVSGKVVALNQRVKEDPSLLNSSPENEGWLFEIELSNPSELDTLLDHQQYILKQK